MQPKISTTKTVRLSRKTRARIFESLADCGEVMIEGIGLIYLKRGPLPSGRIVNKVAIRSERELRLALGKNK